jgi:hypothetical protein
VNLPSCWPHQMADMAEMAEMAEMPPVLERSNQLASCVRYWASSATAKKKQFRAATQSALGRRRGPPRPSLPNLIETKAYLR